MFRYAIIDIETAGYAPGTAPGITEIAILIYENGKVLHTYETLINPECPINPYVSRLTGITDEMVAEAPYFSDVADEINRITEGCVFVAHSVNFDYSYIHSAFRMCGMQYNRQKLCTVRLSRKLLPGHNSYSLGNLCASLGIQLHDRHRAMGDAAATVKVFEQCLLNDAENFIVRSLKRNSRETLLPPFLPREVFDQLPETTGVYYMHDQKGKVIYVGKAINIKSRIAGHFGARAEKLPFFTSIANITYKECGTELIALLLEASEIKKNFPPFNKAQKISNTVYILTTYTDTKGVHRLLVSRNHKVLKPLMTFRNFDKARSVLNQLREQFELCPRFCGIHQVNGACYDFAENKCKGACNDAEPVESYNERVMRAIAYTQETTSSRLIIDKGRVTGEKSVVVIDKGIYRGFGYFDESVSMNTVEEAMEFIEPMKHTADIEHILSAYN